jgi:FtsH-binding integral membrane protein
MFEGNNSPYISTGQPAQGVSVAKSFMANVFLWMTFAMVATAVTAYLFASSQSLIGSLINSETGRMSGLGWIITLAPLGFVLLMSLGYKKLSAPVMILLFITFSILIGMSLSFILLVYTAASVYKTFAITAGMFGVMAITGYTTKTDLTRFGSILFMGVIGLVIAMLVNFFLKSAMMEYIISIIGVLIFTGLTAYDVQKLKRIGAVQMGQEDYRKMAIMGALTLYLDFINLFLFLLRLLGDRR